MVRRVGATSNEASELKSHPHILLRDHVAQVIAATEVIVAGHSRALREDWPDLCACLDQAARLHDAGKGTRAFQEYIAAPGAYRGPRERKAHAPLSMLLALASLPKDGSNWDNRLAVAAAVGCHHSGFRSRRELDHLFASTVTTDVMAEQLSDFPWERATAATGIGLRPLSAADQPWLEALDGLEELGECLDKLALVGAVAFRLRAQLLLSILLEADKAWLAVAAGHLSKYTARERPRLPPEMVERFVARKPSTPLKALQEQARRSVVERLELAQDSRISSVTLPTGTGKTMIAASWALRLRERLGHNGHAPKIVIALPYLSIIDQTQKEYADLLNTEESIRAEGESMDRSPLLMTSHSLSERVFDPEMDGGTNDFFLDTWQSDLVITTFDQLLLALMAPRARHQMRFHNLCDALIVMDEIQTLPCRLWHPLNTVLTQLTGMGNTHVLAMSATQPGFLEHAQELASDPSSYFHQFGRYRLDMHHLVSIKLDSFVNQLLDRAGQWARQRVLITLNTRASARAVRDALDDAGVDPLFFLSADVTPRERLKRILDIKNGEACVVVSTQCVEAGVDIDMDLVLRDFAPLDSLIQIAGRCNRYAKRQRSPVEVYHLVNENIRSYAEMIYDAPLLQATLRVLGDRTHFGEEEVFGMASAYFEELRRERDTGEAMTRAWARWEDTDPVGELLRGKQARQETFVVVEQDPELPVALAEVQRIEDRWERRRRHRALAARLALISVSVYTRPDLDPSDYADRDPLDAHWLLRPGFYRPDRGLDLQRSPDEDTWGLIL